MIDSEEAYDRLSWNLIENTLRDANIPEFLSKTILSRLFSSSFQLLWDSEMSDSFSPHRRCEARRTYIALCICSLYGAALSIYC
ncbi:hypothetical protein Syun_017534 [Stephania yunnanensis]|uniref:Reverse transcriptase domain-containing protein n=1 Tax=Stephania yunnanensis TaxID=152371 RepID=A0AAP0P2H1_9MAGN